MPQPCKSGTRADQSRVGPGDTHARRECHPLLVEVLDTDIASH